MCHYDNYLGHFAPPKTRYMIDIPVATRYEEYTVMFKKVLMCAHRAQRLELGFEFPEPMVEPFKNDISSCWFCIKCDKLHVHHDYTHCVMHMMNFIEFEWSEIIEIATKNGYMVEITERKKENATR